ncbi:hypothetical protein N7472_004642, partial [Penicillium cf. griseofulvum]
PIYSKPFRTAREYLKTTKRPEVYLQYFASKGLLDKIFHDPGYITRHFDTIYLKEEPLKCNWYKRLGNSQAQRTSLHTSLKTPIEPNDTTSGSIELSRKRKRAKRKQPNTLDTYFKRLHKTFDERDQEVKKLDQEVKNLEQEVKKQQKQV